MDKLGRKASKVNDSMMLIPPEKVAVLKCLFSTNSPLKHIVTVENH
jgi:hypothetical protein